MNIKIINKSDNPLPCYKTEGAAGMDIRAFIRNERENMIAIRSGQTVIVPTGLYIELPRNLEAQIRTRSGLCINSGLMVLNAPGTIDTDYRGEIGVILMNVSKEGAIIESGDRIAQMVIAPYIKAKLELVKTLSKTNRGNKGYGSTGLK